MSALHLTRGLPASGKTTFAKKWVAEAPDTRARLNRDDLRAMLHDPYSGYPTERAVSIVQHNATNALLRKGYDVIVDDTNLVARHLREWLKLAERQGAEVVFHDEFMAVPVDVCIAYDEARQAAGGRSVGEDVIRTMHGKYLARGPLAVPELTVEESPAKPYAGTPGKPKAVIVDIDGTLALNTSGRSPYDWSRVGEDSVNRPVAELVQTMHAAGYRIILMSGRDEVCKEATEQWLVLNDLLLGDGPGWDVLPPLLMRAHDDNRRDATVKLELFDLFVRDEFDVKYVIDDRNQVVAAWRSIGLPVLQVADGDF